MESIRVPFGNFLRKDRRSTYEYLTVFIRGDNDEPEYLCKNWEVAANKSYIVTNSGTIVQQQYGGNLWTDRYGVK